MEKGLLLFQIICLSEYYWMIRLHVSMAPQAFNKHTFFLLAPRFYFLFVCVTLSLRPARVVLTPLSLRRLSVWLRWSSSCLSWKRWSEKKTQLCTLKMNSSRWSTLEYYIVNIFHMLRKYNLIEYTITDDAVSVSSHLPMPFLLN